MTKKEMFENLVEIVSEHMEECKEKEELIEKLEKEIELLNRRSISKKPTKKSLENEKYKEEILNFLAEWGGEWKTLDEIRDGIDSVKTFSSQRLSALMRGLINDLTVEKSYNKKKPIFRSTVTEVVRESQSIVIQIQS